MRWRWIWVGIQVLELRNSIMHGVLWLHRNKNNADLVIGRSWDFLSRHGQVVSTFQCRFQTTWVQSVTEWTSLDRGPPLSPRSRPGAFSSYRRRQRSLPFHCLLCCCIINLKWKRIEKNLRKNIEYESLEYLQKSKANDRLWASETLDFIWERLAQNGAWISLSSRLSIS